METGIDLLTKIFHHADEPHQNWKNTILGVLHQVHNHKDKYESKALKRCSELIEITKSCAINNYLSLCVDLGSEKA